MKNLSVFLIILIIINVSFSQVGEKEKDIKRERQSQKDYIQNLYKLRGEEELTGEKRRLPIAAMEGKVNPEEYLLGPGDVLVINFWGGIPKSYQAQILPTGDIIIPSVGNIFISGLSLNAGIEKIIKNVKKVYSGSKVSVSLMYPRMFKVYVEGEVKSPGSYEVYPISRISDAVEMAGGITIFGDKENITVKRKTGEILYFNYTKYHNSGDLDFNPYLHDGDVVFIKKIKFGEGFIYVEGNLDNQGYYKFIEGETISELIERLDIDINSTLWDKCKIIRRNGKNEEVLDLNMFDILENDESVQIKKGDRIVFPFVMEQVFVRGAVKYPGYYPYRGNYVAQDYASTAGIMVEATSINKIKVFRKRTGEYIQGENVRVEKGDVVVVPEKTIYKWRDILNFVTSIASLVIAAKAAGFIK